MNTFHMAMIFLYDLRRVRITYPTRSDYFCTSSLNVSKVWPKSMRTTDVPQNRNEVSRECRCVKTVIFLCTLSKCRISEKWHYYFSYKRFPVRYFINVHTFSSLHVLLSSSRNLLHNRLS